MTTPVLDPFYQVLSVIWIAVWAGHGNCTIVHVLLAAVLVCILFASEMGR